jgi:tetratricopeptide (TPR) repeat protein
MQLLNFPMASILGQKFGDHYEQNAVRAAEAIAKQSGKVYLHCYLGVHRIGTVKKLLEARQIKVARYVLQEGERSNQAKKLDEAEAKFNEGSYQQALTILEEIRAPTPAAVLLHGWVSYKLGDIAAARKYFTTADGLLQNASDPRIGIAYCDYRDNALAAAEQGFASVLSKDPGNVDALNGLGLVFVRQQRMKEAEDAFRKVLQLDPKHQEAKAQLQKIQSLTGKP